MTMIRLCIEASEANAASMASVRGLKDFKVLSHNTKSRMTIIQCDIRRNWDVIFAWWRSSEVAGLRRTLAGDEIA